MKWASHRSLRLFTRWVWGTLVFLVIFLAVCVQLGRSAFPYLNDYKPHIESQLTRALNANIHVGEIEASWDGLRPALKLIDVEVSGGPHEGSVRVAEMSAEVNLLATFKDWRLALGQLHFKGLQVELRQADSGHWAIVGLPQTKASNNNFTIDDPLDIFLFGRRIELIDTEVTLHFRTEHRAQMTIPAASLENDAGFHRLKAKVDVDSDSNAFYFVVEGQGDPRDDQNFNARGYLQLQQFPLQKVVAATGLNKGLAIEPGLWSDGSRLDFQLWFTGSTAKGYSFNGGGKASGLPFKLPGDAEAPAIPQFKYSGQWRRGQGLTLQIADLGLSWPSVTVPPIDVQLRASLSDPVQFNVRELDVGAWAHALGELKLSPQISALQETLAPAGVLKNIGVTLTDKAAGYFHLQADVVDGAVESWQGAPQVRHATGFVEATAWQGRMVINANDGFSMHYPIVYKKPLNFHEASGEVAWFVRLDENMVYVTSGLLNLKGESGEGAGYLYLSLPTKRSDETEPEMTLLVGMRESVARYHEAYVPFTIPDSLYEWLGRSIKEGGLKDGGFIYRGSLLKTPKRPRSLQLSMKIQSGELAFDPAWPRLEKADATLLVDDLALKVAIDEAKILGNQLTNGRVSLVEDGEDMALAISADASGDVSQALALLRQSPVQDVAGDALSQFAAKGVYDGHVELFVPLNGGMNSGWQNIEARMQGAEFALPDLDLTFNKVASTLNYHTQKGLSAKQITGQLWGRQLTGQLKTISDDKGKYLQLDFDGSVAVGDLNAWLKRPLFEYMNGKSQVSGELKLPFDHPEQGIELSAKTDLVGIELNYPAPFNKAASEPTSLNVHFLRPQNAETGILTLASSQGVQSQLMLQGEHLLGLDVGFGESAAVMPGSMRLHGQLRDIEIEPWSEFVIGYLASLDKKAETAKQGTAGSSDSFEPVKFSMGLEVTNANLKGLQLEHLGLWGKELDDSWYFDIETPQAVANFRKYFEEKPSQLHIEYLHLPEFSEEGEQRKHQSMLADTALEHLEAIDVKIDELAVGGQGWGHIAFDYRPQARGLVAKRIRGNLRGLKTLDGTLAIYKRDTNDWESSFSGKVNTADIGAVMQNFDQPRMLTTQESQFDVSLNWPGYPDQIDLQALSGTLDLTLVNGRFIAGSSGGDSGLLKLISLLNFDTLVRRLKLDFSDLHPEGLSFDQVTGRLYFDKQMVHLNEDTPLQVDTTSADLQMIGDIDLAKQTVDSQVIATLPLAGNLAVAAALTAGLPAAVGVYVVGKLFKEQVNDLASVRYTMKGTWDDPKLEVDKVFESRTKSRAHEAVEENAANDAPEAPEE